MKKRNIAISVSLLTAVAFVIGCQSKKTDIDVDNVSDQAIVAEKSEAKENKKENSNIKNANNKNSKKEVEKLKKERLSEKSKEYKNKKSEDINNSDDLEENSSESLLKENSDSEEEYNDDNYISDSSSEVSSTADSSEDEEFDFENVEYENVDEDDVIGEWTIAQIKEDETVYTDTYDGLPIESVMSIKIKENGTASYKIMGGETKDTTYTIEDGDVKVDMPYIHDMFYNHYTDDFTNLVSQPNNSEQIVFHGIKDDDEHLESHVGGDHLVMSLEKAVSFGNIPLKVIDFDAITAINNLFGGSTWSYEGYFTWCGGNDYSYVTNHFADYYYDIDNNEVIACNDSKSLPTIYFNISMFADKVKMESCVNIDGNNIKNEKVFSDYCVDTDKGVILTEGTNEYKFVKYSDDFIIVCEKVNDTYAFYGLRKIKSGSNIII